MKYIPVCCRERTDEELLTSQGNFINLYCRIPGRIVLDTFLINWIFNKSNKTEKNTFSLKSLAENVLCSNNFKKLEIDIKNLSSLYFKSDSDRKKIVQYCIRDCEIVTKLLYSKSSMFGVKNFLFNAIALFTIENMNLGHWVANKPKLLINKYKNRRLTCLKDMAQFNQET